MNFNVNAKINSDFTLKLILNCHYSLKTYVKDYNQF